jgi:RNA polymerase sigma-70 factor (ECF subfamily)
MELTLGTTQVEEVSSLTANPPQLSDDELVAAVCAGDESAFARLFERHRHRVAALAYRFFQRREQVEDIIQESFTRAWFGMKSFQGGREFSFAAWMSRITVHTCYDELRRLQRRSENALSDLTEDELAYLHERLRDDSTEGRVESAAISRDLAGRLLSRLDAEDRLVMTLLELEELKISEVAEVVGWTEAKVKTRAHRARLSLRKVLSRLL